MTITYVYLMLSIINPASEDSGLSRRLREITGDTSYRFTKASDLSCIPYSIIVKGDGKTAALLMNAPLMKEYYSGLSEYIYKGANSPDGVLLSGEAADVAISDALSKPSFIYIEYHYPLPLSVITFYNGGHKINTVKNEVNTFYCDRIFITPSGDYDGESESDDDNESENDTGDYSFIMTALSDDGSVYVSRISDEDDDSSYSTNIISFILSCLEDSDFISVDFAADVFDDGTSAFGKTAFFTNNILSVTDVSFIIRRNSERNNNDNDNTQTTTPDSVSVDSDDEIDTETETLQDSSSDINPDSESTDDSTGESDNENEKDIRNEILRLFGYNPDKISPYPEADGVDVYVEKYGRLKFSSEALVFEATPDSGLPCGDYIYSSDTNFYDIYDIIVLTDGFIGKLREIDSETFGKDAYLALSSVAYENGEAILTYDYMFNNVRIDTGEDHAVEMRVRISDSCIVYFSFRSFSCKNNITRSEIAKSLIIAPSYSGNINTPAGGYYVRLAYDVNKSAAIWQVYARDSGGSS